MTPEQKKAIEAFKDKYVCALNSTEELSMTDIIEQNFNAIDAGAKFALTELCKPSERPNIKDYTDYNTYAKALDTYINRLEANHGEPERGINVGKPSGELVENVGL